MRLLQPETGYRAATDPVLLAAAVPAQAGEAVLDLGCGAGAAALCLAARVPGAVLSGLEIQAEYLDLAERNAGLNGVALDLHDGDVARVPAALRARSFDHVMMNPPWFAPSATASPDVGRDRAHRADESGLAPWFAAALARLKPRGSLTVIHRAEALGEMLACLGAKAGDVTILPLAARTCRDAKRVILSARKGARGPLRLAAPLVLHEGAAHLADRDDFTGPAQAILRDAAPLIP